MAATPAFAGGSWFETTEKQYEPGDTVTLIGYTSGGQLGWIEDGPFYGYLRVRRPDPATADRWPAVYPTDLALGPLQLEKTGPGGQTLRATITFDLPRDLAPAAYQFEYCDDPCTTGLGDLIGGTVYVGVSPQPGQSALPPSTIARTSAPGTTTDATRDPSTTTTRKRGLATATQGPTRTSGDRASGTLAGLALVAAAAAGVLLTRRRNRSSAVRTLRWREPRPSR